MLAVRFCVAAYFGREGLVLFLLTRYVYVTLRDHPWIRLLLLEQRETQLVPKDCRG